MNITDSIWRKCLEQPGQTAVILDGKPSSYGDLLRSVRVVSARLAEAGVRRGDCVAVGLDNPLAFLVVVLALARMGAVSTLYLRQWPQFRKDLVIQRHRVRALVVSAPVDEPGLEGVSVLEAGRLFSVAGAEGLSVPEPALDVDDCNWWIGLSSGTTGMPKSIPQTHRRGLLSVALHLEPYDFSRLALMVSQYLGLGLANALRCLTAGGVLILSSRHDPEQFFEVLQRDRPTRVLTTTGNVIGYAAHATSHPAESQAACSSLKAITLTGSTVSPALLDRVRHHLCQLVQIDYGASEAGLMAALDQDDLARHEGVQGRLLPWVQAQAVDEAGLALPPGQVGLLRFKTPVLADGYLGDEATTAQVFREGWFYPGDTGSVDAAGYLRLGGRSSQVLNLGGRKIDPVQVEAVLNRCPGVLESAVVAAAAEASALPVLVAVIVAAQGSRDQLVASELQAACLQELGPMYVPAQVVLVDSLPKNDGGKLMRDVLSRSIRFHPAGAV